MPTKLAWEAMSFPASQLWAPLSRQRAEGRSQDPLLRPAIPLTAQDREALVPAHLPPGASPAGPSPSPLDAAQSCLSQGLCTCGLLPSRPQMPPLQAVLHCCSLAPTCSFCSLLTDCSSPRAQAPLGQGPSPCHCRLHLPQPGAGDALSMGSVCLGATPSPAWLGLWRERTGRAPRPACLRASLTISRSSAELQSTHIRPLERAAVLSARALSPKEGPPGGEHFGDSHGKCPSRWASWREHEGEKPP